MVVTSAVWHRRRNRGAEGVGAPPKRWEKGLSTLKTWKVGDKAKQLCWVQFELRVSVVLSSLLCGVPRSLPAMTAS